MKSVKISRYVSLFKKGDKYCLYHALKLKKVYGIEGLSQIFEATQNPTGEEALLEIVSKEIVDDLKEVGILIPVDFDEQAEIRAMRRAVSATEYQPMCLYLLVATGCNYRCEYCCLHHSVDDFHSQAKMMTNEVMREAVNELFVASPDPQYICFFGGEPLINFPLIKKTVEYVEAEYPGKRVSYRINTNGSLVTSEVAKFLSRHDFVVAVSIDGPQAYHDVFRVHKDRSGTFNETIRGWNLLKQAGCKHLGVVTVVHSRNADFAEGITLFALDELGADSVNFEPVETVPNPATSDMCASPEKAAQALIRNFQILESRGKLENYISRFLLHFLKEEVLVYRCSSRHGRLIVDPEGNKGPCFNFMGTKHFSKDNSQLGSEWKTITPLNIPDCASCPAIGICGGICVAHANLVGGSLHSIDRGYSCEIMRQILEWMIWDLEARLSSDESG